MPPKPLPLDQLTPAELAVVAIGRLMFAELKHTPPKLRAVAH